VIQDAAVDADQVQSRVVSIVTVPEPPAAGAFDNELLADSWHFEVVGAVISVEDDSQPAINRQTTTTEMSGNGRNGRSLFPCDSARAPRRKFSKRRERFDTANACGPVR
jgi:hypothetical protein